MTKPRQEPPAEIEHVLVEVDGELRFYERRTRPIGTPFRRMKRNEYRVNVDGIEVPMTTTEAVLDFFLQKENQKV